MTTRSLFRRLLRLESQRKSKSLQARQTLERIREDPQQIMLRAGMPPDDWQAKLLRSSASRMLLLCSRQSGKSTTAAALALRTALLRPRAPILLLSPSLRQSLELFRKVVELNAAIGSPIRAVAKSAQRLELANGSRVISLPGDEKTVRGFSGVSMLIIDEAARVSDNFYFAVRPMLAVSLGYLVALSTPFGKRGWFHDEWHGTGNWERIRVTADQCPRITAEFLAEEQRTLGERWYRQEYLCSFEDNANAVFNYADIQAAVSDEVRPLFPCHGFR
jgi:Terminase large subunit, T4likevirus-type, N-terminal